MDRRDFLKTSLVVGGTFAISSSVTNVEAASHLNGIIYTKDNEGMWKGKAGGHVPMIKIQDNKVTVTTKHPMTEPHYIVRHTLVASDGKVIGGKVFKPTDTEAVSSYELPAGFKGKLYATSFCNLHDLWMSEATV